MKRDLILKLAASTMVISTTLTGCGPFGGSVASVSSKPATEKDGAKYAKKAEKALAKGQIDKAVIYAERSVEGVGTNSETRALLGQAYLAAGRFNSAERSFMDAMDLGANDARTVLSLALAQLGQGKADKAKRLVENNRNAIPVADYGLAMALAGETKVAVDVLEQAIRDANVNGRTRQNLGLAYALDGRWKEAKLMASQDIKPAAVDKRVMQWAQMARPGAYEVRVASLLNVNPVKSDPGQPVRLALNAAPTVVAVAETPAEDYAQEVASFDTV
ncbi:MAG: SPOR domain-containing protein, partial [Pseudomonadota bacterium]